jgi:hypothetical protein
MYSDRAAATVILLRPFTPIRLYLTLLRLSIRLQSRCEWYAHCILPTVHIILFRARATKLRTVYISLAMSGCLHVTIREPLIIFPLNLILALKFIDTPVWVSNNDHFAWKPMRISAHISNVTHSIFVEAKNTTKKKAAERWLNKCHFCRAMRKFPSLCIYEYMQNLYTHTCFM